VAITADTPLAEQDWARGRQADGERDRDQQRCHDEDRDPREDTVERVFDHEFPSAGIGRMNRKDGKPANEVDGRPGIDRLVQAGHHDDVNPELVALAKLSHDLSIRRRGERQDELTCSRPPDRLPKVVKAAEQRNCSPGTRLIRHRIGIDVADRVQPGGRVVPQMRREFLADHTRADDDRPRRP
jgi:hypothetical protein